MDRTIANNMKFADLVETLENIASTNRSSKYTTLEKFFTDFKVTAMQKKDVDPLLMTTIFPCIRLILPQLDRERGPYGIKSVVLAKKIIKLLSLPDKGEDARHLLSSSTGSSSSDFCEVAYRVLKKYFTNGGNFDLSHINNFLDKLAEKHGGRAKECLDKELFHIFQQSSALEQKWLMRMVLKNMKLGLGAEAILKAYHLNAPEFFSTTNNLRKICEDLVNVNVPAIITDEVRMFFAFQPMLSKRCEKGEVKKVLDSHRTIFIEQKYDGERFQLHMKDGDFKYFSRRGFDYTEHFGKDFDSGHLSKYIRSCFVNTTSIILDGEMMGYDKVTGLYGSKGMNFDVKNMSELAKHQACFVVFDILQHNDRTLVDTKLYERLEILKAYVHPMPGRLDISEHVTATTAEEVVTAINRTIDLDQEGIVLKDPHSLYKVNARTAGWWKLKPDYFSGVVTDLDVLVLGGFYGTGHMSQVATSFLVGVKDINSNRFFSFARVSNGLTNAECTTLHDRLHKFYMSVHPQDFHLSHGIHWRKELPQFYISPPNSVILEVRGSELVKDTNDNYCTPYTLRFARIITVRDDKPYNDCLTMQDVIRLTEFNRPVEKLFARYVDLSDFSHGGKRRYKTRVKTVQFSETEKQSDILEGYELCVLSGTTSMRKEDLERLIISHSGTISKEPTRATLCAIAGKAHPKVEASKTTNPNTDIVYLEWLLSIIHEKAFTMYGPSDTIHYGPETADRFMDEYDTFGDPLEPTDVPTLKRLCQRILERPDDAPGCSHSPPKTVQTELMLKGCYKPFQGKVCYFDPQNFKRHSSCYIMTVFEVMGGRISSRISKNIDYITTTSEIRTRELRREFKTNGNNKVSFLKPDAIRNKWMEHLKTGVKM